MERKIKRQKVYDNNSINEQISIKNLEYKLNKIGNICMSLDNKINNIKNTINLIENKITELDNKFKEEIVEPISSDMMNAYN